MLGFLKRRVLKEHIMIVTQNAKAVTYVGGFIEPDEETRFLKTLSEIRAAWKPGEKLSDAQFNQMWEMNKSLRRAYDFSPAGNAGLKSFDEEFKPLLGWDEYCSQYL